MATGISGHASQPAVYAVIITSNFLALLAVALRLYTRFIIVKKPDWDDLLSALALFFNCIFTVSVALQTHYGLGRYLHTLTTAEQTNSLLSLFIAVLAYQVCLGLAKLSITAQCIRVFGAISRFRLTCWILVAFLIIYTLYTCLITIFLCQPVSFWWDIDNPNGKCLPRLPLWFLNAARRIITDIAVAILPIPVVKSLHLPTRQKNMLIIVFLLGGAVYIVSIIRFYSLYAVATSNDWTYDDAQTAIYSGVEVSFSTIFGCLPSYNAFVGKYFPNFYYGAEQQQGVVGTLNMVSNGTSTGSETDGSRNDSAKEMPKTIIIAQILPDV